MRQIRRILQLHFEQGLSQRLIARSLGVVRSTVERMMLRFAASGLTWPLDVSLDDAALERALYLKAPNPGVAKGCVRPDWALAFKSLERKGVTRRLLWTEYRALHPDGIGYSVYCEELAAYLSDRELSWRRDHVPGERGYFDFAGVVLRYRGDGGAERSAQIFVAALGWSNAIFAYAYADQSALSWLDGQGRAFQAFGGVPQIGVPDNPRALVSKADRFEPKLTQAYADFARHHGITIIPARVRKPKDKASVEGAVKVVTMRILATVRDRVFESLLVLNTWLAESVTALNAAPFQKRVGSRLAALNDERAHLKPLNPQRFELASYLLRKVARDYHVDVDRQYYSVPYRYVGTSVEVRVTLAHIEVFQREERICVHPRATLTQRFVTIPAHMPSHHRAFNDPKVAERAARIGPATAQLIDALFLQRRHPEQALRSAQGILALARDHGKAALETACAQALRFDAISYSHVKRLLASAANAPATQAPITPIASHELLRGGGYFVRQNATTNQTESHHAA
jgi:transposase